MKVEFFDLPLQKQNEVELPLPMRFLHFSYVPGHVRIHYMLSPAAKEERATFYLIRSDQELPDTFPGEYLATVQNILRNDDKPGVCTSLHLFIKAPGSGPRKPLVINTDKKEP